MYRQEKAMYWMVVLASVVLVIIGVCLSGAKAGTPVQFVTVGWSDTNESIRNIGYGVPQNGWYHSVIDQRIEGWAAEFKKHDLPFRINLHNPWGTNAGQPMDFDQYLEAKENPLLRVMVQSFPLWLETRVKPLVGEDGECILYLGTIRADADMVALEGDPELYYKRAKRCLDAIPPWCSVAFDSVNAIKADHPAWPVIKDATRRFKRVYVEPRPSVDSPTKSLNVFSGNAHNWFRTDPEVYPNIDHLCKTSDLTGERLVRPRDRDPATRLEWYKKIIAEGSTPVLYSMDDLEMVEEIK